MADPMTAPSGEAIRQLIDRAKASADDVIGLGNIAEAENVAPAWSEDWREACEDLRNQIAALDAYARQIDVVRWIDNVLNERGFTHALDNAEALALIESIVDGMNPDVAYAGILKARELPAAPPHGARETPPSEWQGICADMECTCHHPTHAEQPAPTPVEILSATVTELRAALARMTEERDTALAAESVLADLHHADRDALAALREASGKLLDAILAEDPILETWFEAQDLRALLPPPERGDQ